MERGSQIPIFVINLERSKDRRNDISNHLNEQDLKFSFINAVDGKLLDKEYISDINKEAISFKNKYQRELLPGEIGCSLSHLNAYEEIINLNLPYACIIEDDVISTQGFKSILLNEKTKACLNEGIDLILLGYMTPSIKCQKGICLDDAILSFWGRKRITNTISIGRPVFDYWTTMGYIISNKGAHILLKNGNPPLMLADQLTCYSPLFGVNLYLTNSPIILPNPQNHLSDIGFKPEIACEYNVFWHRNPRIMSFKKILYKFKFLSLYNSLSRSSSIEYLKIFTQKASFSKYRYINLLTITK